MKRLLAIVAAVLGLVQPLAAQTALLQYQPGNRLINGSQLNLMVNQVNGLTGNGTRGAVVGTTGNFTGAVATNTLTVSSTSATCLTVGPNGATNPVLQVACSTASAATGLKATGAAAAAGLDLSVISSGTDENLTINAKGAGTITLNPTGTGNVVLSRAATGISFSGTGLLTSRSGTATPAAASAVAALSFGSAGVSIYWGTGDPSATVTAAKGSVYIRTDGSSSSTRMYINTDGVTAWAAVTTAS